MYVLLVISILFFLQDKYFLSLDNVHLKNKTIIRLLSNFILGTILYFIINKEFIFTSKLTLNNSLIMASVYLIINLFINVKTININDNLRKNIRNISKIIFIILILECTLFNYKHYLTYNNNEINVENYELDNLIINGDKYILETPTKSGIYINIKDINVNSIYFKISNSKDKLLKYDVNMLDNDSNKYIKLNSTNCYKGVVNSYYKIIHNTYKSDKLYITFIDEIDSEYRIDDIIINPNIPMLFSIYRVLILLVISVIAYIFRPSSNLYKIKLNSNKNTVFMSIFIFSMIIIFILIITTNLNRVFIGNRYYQYKNGAPSINEYQSLAESFTKGKLHLLEEPSDILKNMDNPYNTYYREKLFKNSNDHYIWDVAYYNNHYYVYFGVVPVILLYLPIYLLTGSHISNNIVVLIGLIGVVMNIILLLKLLINKYLKSISVGVYLLSLIFIIFCNHFVILYAAKRPDFYTIPIIWGIMFSLIGLDFWLKSKKKNGDLNKTYLLLGSLSMALVAGCRPQLLLTSFSAIAIFWDELKERKIFSKKTIKETICLVFPYIVIALLLMWYNYARFGSPFDFGANYNLTTNDMTARGFNIERIGLGLYYYLFAIPNFNNVFPFVSMLPKRTSYIGITIYEKMFGGIITMSPLLLISLFLPKFKKYFNNKMLYKIAGWFTIAALIIIIVDTNMAGILPRYCIDFSWLLVISTVLILLSVIDYFKNNEIIINIITKIFYIIVLVLLVFNLLIMFIDVSFPYSSTLPTIFYKIYYLVQFWL